MMQVNNTNVPRVSSKNAYESVEEHTFPVNRRAYNAADVFGVTHQCFKRRDPQQHRGRHKYPSSGHSQGGGLHRQGLQPQQHSQQRQQKQFIRTQKNSGARRPGHAAAEKYALPNSNAPAFPLPSQGSNSSIKQSHSKTLTSSTSNVNHVRKLDPLKRVIIQL